MAYVKDNSDGRKALEDEIRALESAEIMVETPKLPQVKLEEKKYDAPSDAMLEKTAENSLANYKKDGVESIMKNSADSEKALRDKRDGYMQSLDADIAELKKSYEAAADSIDSDVIKRGLARSSVAVNAKGELEKELFSSEAAVRSSYGKKIADLDAEIGDVSAKLTKALDDFNIAYAAKLNQTLESLKKERENNINEAIKFNNDVKAKQAQLDAERLKTESKLHSEALDNKKKATSLDNLSNEEMDELYSAIYDKMDKFLSSLSPEQAKLEIRNHSMYQSHLSAFYYYRLYDKYGR